MCFLASHYNIQPYRGYHYIQGISPIGPDTLLLAYTTSINATSHIFTQKQATCIDCYSFSESYRLGLSSAVLIVREKYMVYEFHVFSANGTHSTVILSRCRIKLKNEESSI